MVAQRKLAVSHEELPLASVVEALLSSGFHVLLKGEDVQAMVAQTGRGVHKHFERRTDLGQLSRSYTSHRMTETGCRGRQRRRRRLWVLTLLTAPSPDDGVLSVLCGLSQLARTHDVVFRRVEEGEDVGMVSAVNEEFWAAGGIGGPVGEMQNAAWGPAAWGPAVFFGCLQNLYGVRRDGRRAV